MNIEIMKNISLTGRIAYGIMCAENYAISIVPDGKWSLLFKPMWKVVSERVIWDVWAVDIIGYFPEFLEEYCDYQAFENDFSKYPDDIYLDKNAFDDLKKLYRRIPSDFNDILMTLRDMAFDYQYTGFHGFALDIIRKLLDIEEILNKHAIDLPDESLLTFSKYSENDGFGYPFDSKPFSKFSCISN